MQQTLISLLNAATGVEAASGQRAPAAAPAGEGLFARLLGRATSQSPQAGGAGTNVQGTTTPLDLAALLSALVGKDVKSFVQALQATAGTSAGQTNGAARTGNGTASAGSVTDGAAASGSKGKDDATGGKGIGRDEGSCAGTGQELESLLMGLLSLVIKNKAVADDNSGTDAAAGTDDEKGTAAAANTAQASGDAVADGKSKQDDQSILGTLSLLLFASIEAAGANQGAASRAAGGTGSGAPENGRDGKGSGLSVQWAAGGPDAAGGATKPADTDILPREDVNVSPAGITAIEGLTTPELTASVKAELTSTPTSPEGQTGKNSLTLTIKAPSGVVEYNKVAGGAAGSSAAAPAADQEGQNGNGVVTIVSELTSLMETGGGASREDAAGKDKSADKESYPFTPEGEVSVANAAEQEQKTSGETYASGSIERFDRVVEQLAGRTGPHDLTVRLTLGNEESLVLGLKDLGHSVTVDVRSSDQGMIGLLQSQRDVIMRHLEGKDIHAQIVIDPNASGTQEQRERREARQKTFTPRNRGDGNFGTFLETFA